MKKIKIIVPIIIVFLVIVSVVVLAYYKRVKVTLDYNCNNVDTIICKVKNHKVNCTFPTPKCEDSSFVGWYDKKNGGKLIDINGDFYNSTTIYAHYTNNKQKKETPEEILTGSSKGGLLTKSLLDTSKIEESAKNSEEQKIDKKISSSSKKDTNSSSSAQNNSKSKSKKVESTSTSKDNTKKSTSTQSKSSNTSKNNSTKNNSINAKNNNQNKDNTNTNTEANSSTPKEVAVSSISLNHNNASIYIGGTILLTSTLAPANATNKSVTWISSNNNVATVNNGNVTAIKPGTAIITVSTKNGKTANCTITVLCKPSKIHFMNTGGSDAIIIESCGHYGLVDSSNGYRDGTSQCLNGEDKKPRTVEHVIDYIKKITGCSSDCKGKLDFVIATHSHSDHIGGMVRIAEVFVNNNTSYYYRHYNDIEEKRNILLDNKWDNSGYYNRAFNKMRAENAKLVEITNHKTSFNFYDLNIDLLISETYLTNENNNSIVELITHNKGTKVLLAGDIEKDVEWALKDEIGKVNILKVPHHGYESSSSRDFLEKLHPEYMIITESEVYIPNNLCYGQRNGAKVYTTGSAQDAIVLHFNESGLILSKDDGSKVPSQDSCSKGWVKAKNGCWYYYNDLGVYLKGWQKLQWTGGTNWF